MGWLKKVIEKIDGSSAETSAFTFAPSVVSPDIPGIGILLIPDECYVEIYLESLRLSRARHFATRFHGLVYSFITLQREGDVQTKLAAVSKPEKLAELDKDSLNKVITISKQVMGAIAYRGGPISIEMGLFSVKSGNLLSPILDYITKVSSTAGISYVDAIKPFVPLIVEGMDLIAGQSEDTNLEVGLDTDMNFKLSSCCAIIALPSGSFESAKLSLKDGVLYLAGKELECGYAVFSLRHSEAKWDYGEIPELKSRFAELLSAIRAGKRKEARDALISFRLATIASSDLIPSDAQKLYTKAKARYDLAFPEGGEASLSAKLMGNSLSEIGLYD